MHETSLSNCYLGLAVTPGSLMLGGEVSSHLGVLFIYMGVFFSNMLLIGDLILRVFEVGQGFGAFEVGLLFIREWFLFAAAVECDVANVCGPSPSVVLGFVEGVVCCGEVTQFDLHDPGFHIPDVSLDGLEEGSQFEEKVIRWCQSRWG